MKDEIRCWLKQQFGDDEALFAELYSQYRADMVAGVEELNALVKGTDPKAMRQKAHALKGVALLIGDKAAADICLELQKLGDAGTFAGADAVLASLTKLVNALDPQ